MRLSKPGRVLVAPLLLLSTLAFAAPSITLSKKIGPPTSEIAVFGNGFEPHVLVDIYFDTEDEAVVLTNDEGEFQHAVIHAPREARPGDHWIAALERNNDKGDQEPFVVNTNWPQSLDSPGQTGFNAYENVLNPANVPDLTPRWNDNSETYVSPPAISNGVAYFGGSADLFALNASTGELLWSYPTFGPPEYSPAVVDGVVYFGGYQGDVYALDARSGALLWSYTSPGFTWGLTVAHGAVYYDSGSTVSAVNAKTGALLWTYVTEFPYGSQIAVADGVVYVGSSGQNEGKIYALNARTGNVLWTYLTEAELAPVVANGIVYVTSEYKVYALKASTGALLWKFATGNYNRSPAVVQNVIYVGSDNGFIYALNADTGVPLWRQQPGGSSSPPCYSPVAANGVLYVSCENEIHADTTYALKASTGAVLWQYTQLSYPFYDGYAMAIANGLLYVSSFHEGLWAFSLPSFKASGSTARPDPKMLHPNLTLRPSSSTTPAN
jgi:outer membrane protein assembly factor BamB